MNAERLLQEYERISDAPDAIARLRRFVLDLAVRGKLVPQDPNDEPATELLKRIAKEKARLVKAGELRKPRDLDTGGGVHEPFVIPASWRWVRLDGVGAIVGGGTPSATDPNNFAEPGEGVPWLTPADLGGYSDLYISRGSRDLSEMGAKASSATLMPKGTVLFTSRAPIGYVAIASNPISTNQGFKSIVPYVLDCSRFISTAMKAFAPEIDAKAPGTTFKEVSGKIVAAVPFPLPPLAEQHRIVAKVDELMALCDRLEAERAQREAVRDRLTTASLARLSTPEPETFPDAARFVLNALPALTARPDQIKRLRQAILDLAVRGKLVPQDPNDEPASELLKRIAKDRIASTAEGRLKPIGGIPSEARAEGWDIPGTWMILPLPSVVYFQEGPGLRNWQFRPSGVPFLNIRTLQNGRVNRELCQFLDPDEVDTKYRHFLVRDGDILCSTSGTIGKLAVARVSDLPLMLNTSIVRFSTYGDHGPDRDFIKLFLGTDRFLGQAAKSVTGSAQVNMGPSHLKLMAFPLPPLAEQHRIVAKVDELMALCDRLEASLAEGAKSRSRLLEALLAEALAPLESAAA